MERVTAEANVSDAPKRHRALAGIEVARRLKMSMSF
jgi:hypothetical protein